MSKEKFLNPDYTADENTREEIETLHKDGESLSGIQLKLADMKNAKLVNADLSNTDLTRADFSGASLYGVNLEGANLFKTNLEGANLKSANMKNCNMLGADFTNTRLNNVDFGADNKAINEIEADSALSSGNIDLANEKYKESEDIYRALKMSLQSQSLGEDAGKIFLREMIVKRKQLPLLSPLRIAHKFAHLAFGYGEKIGNILYSIITVIIISAIFYGIEGVSYGNYTLGFWGDVEQFGGILNVIGNLLYFSVVVFSTVGFGEILPIGPLGKSIMMVEGIAGGLILSIFMIAVYRQLMDR
ncbi:MAG: pentapeptide repeat-containing protein [Candidatus Marinimicrobia bacterium]|jgi:hypothetical protein|nr:pentapeptide repeat-containing protein [Candidatus Neomarinimicrobiota bacterium]